MGRKFKDANHELVTFANSLAPSKRYIKVARKLMHAILLDLQQLFSISRSRLSGSMGKCTSVLNPDIDYVIFLCRALPPFTDQILQIYNKLKEKADFYGIVQESIEKSSRSVTFSFINGIKVDLLPAVHFSTNLEEQVEQVHAEIRKNPENHLAYSSSVTEFQLQIVKDQPVTTKQVIRLTKLWFKFLPFKAHGGSYLMEIICTATALKMKSSPVMDLFREALKQIGNISTLKIGFIHQNGIWNSIFEKFKQYPTFHRGIITKQRFIIDAANGWNDLLGNFTEDNRNVMMASARAVLQRLDSDVIHMDELFKPLRLGQLRRDRPKYIAVDYHYQKFQGQRNAISSYVKVELRDGSFFENHENLKKVTKMFEKSLLAIILTKARRLKDSFSYIRGVADVKSPAEAEDAVEDFLKENLAKVPRSDNHQGCDVNLLIPYRYKGQIFHVRFGMKW